MKPLTEREIITLAKQCGMRACTSEEHHDCPYGDEGMEDCMERLEADCEAAIERALERWMKCGPGSARRLMRRTSPNRAIKRRG